MRLCKFGKVFYYCYNMILKNTSKSETSQLCLHTLILTHRSTDEIARSGSDFLQDTFTEL